MGESSKLVSPKTVPTLLRQSLVPPPTRAIEDYLKAIYDLARDAGADGRVTTGAIADRLSIAPASATGMVKKLAEMHLVEHVPYGGVVLTEAGRRIAVETIRHHRLVETYLHEALGVPWDRLHAEAERWEHVLSEDVEARMDRALGFPTHDPHGAPIPTAALDLTEPDFPALGALPAGATGVVAAVRDEDAALLRAAAHAGLFPGTALRVDAPGADGVTVTVGGRSHWVSATVAAAITVRPAP